MAKIVQMYKYYKYLPHSGFKWLNKKETDKFCLNSNGKNSSDV